ncbi:MAG: ATP-binding cassette domain-containing protein [Barnesiella sp.]|nr:ATP-binding cassette domain-containing protein [Barnesiella sp.]MBD5254075.1 ATP-binding cassette domain-containing protein [Barnesiella sp.]MBD5343917.1 ATP-binding cassette domain-containing protein [Bacteroides sp.]
MDYIISARNITKRYANHTALDDVTVEIPRGSVYGLLGPNGAGKTTLIRILNHITAPDSGIVTFDGHPLTQNDVEYIGYLPEERGLYKKMKVGDQAVFFARLKGLSASEATRSLRSWFEKFDILDWWDKKVEELSKGMAQKVQFIVTVLHKPKLLIFDEPFSGFDPINANLLKSEILNLRDNGSTIIFSTHNMASVEEICDHITLINQSHNILTGNVEEIRRQFFGNRYEVTYNGVTPELIKSLDPVASDFVPGVSDGQGRPSLLFRLNEDASVRNAIEIINSTVEIAGFKESIASMNDIFIRAVEKSNLNNTEK